MSKMDIRLDYQRVTGDCLDTIQKLADNNDPETQSYIDWLEERVTRLMTGIKAWESANTIATAAQKAIHGKNNT